jgi:undecaprenyl-diphosphatase
VEQIINFDQYLFNKINLDWTHQALDWFLPRITDLHKNPIFLIFVASLIGSWIWRARALAAKWVLILILSVGLADLVSYRILKANVQRDRPQYSGIQVQLRTHQHSGTSFPSNHAANMFAAATVMTLAFPMGWPLFFMTAFAVAYSRVYVGVHFPLDVSAGALLGVLMALMSYQLLRRILFRNDVGSSHEQN